MKDNIELEQNLTRHHLELAMKNKTKQAYDNNELGVLFHRIAKMMARSYHRHSHAHHAQAHIFSIIREKGPISQRDLMKMLDVRSSSLSEIIRKLELRDLIDRTRDDNDKRGYIIAVKEGSENPFPEKIMKDQPAREEFFATLQDEEKAQLAALLEKIIQSAHEHGHKENECKHSQGCKSAGHHGHYNPGDNRLKIKK